MDLLGSILDSMDKPPTLGDKQKILIKKQKEDFEKRQAKEREDLKKFREQIEERINKFIQDPVEQKFKFKPMEKVHRSIVHDIADVAGLTAFSFGEEEVDRYVMLFKKEFAPTDDELLAYRKGEDWTPEKAKEVARLKELTKQAEEEEARSKPVTVVPNSNYKDKYEKLIGRESAKDAARIATPNRQFGFVPSENKKDQRSIEQTLADLRAKKKQKVHEQEDCGVGSSAPDGTTSAPDGTT